jgi:hypothetical protein
MSKALTTVIVIILFSVVAWGQLRINPETGLLDIAGPTGPAGPPGSGITEITTGCGLSGGTITTTGTVARSEAVNAQTGTTYTYVTGDCGKLVTHSNAAAIAGTLPQAGVSFPAGWFMDVQNRGAGTLTITPTTSTIDGAASLALVTNSGARIVSDGTNYFTMRGSGGSGGGATTLDSLTDVTATAVNRHVVIGNAGATGFETRALDTSDILGGTFVDGRVATGTATNTFVPKAVAGASPEWGAVTAAEVVNTPAGGIAATTSQAALNELDTEKQPIDADLTTLAGKTLVGTGANLRFSTGSVATDDCAKFDANGNIVSAGAACGSGGGSLPSMTGNANEVLTNDGTNARWEPLVGGASGCLDFTSPFAPDFDFDCLLTQAFAWTGYHDYSGGQIRFPEVAFASLPAAAGNTGKVFVVTDASAAGVCTAGGSTAKALCRSNGTIYESLGGSGSTPSVPANGPYLSNFTNTYGAAATGTMLTSSARLDLIQSPFTGSISQCRIRVTVAVDTAVLTGGVYNPDGTKVCSGTATLSGTGAQNADLTCSGAVLRGQYYLLGTQASVGGITAVVRPVPSSDLAALLSGNSGAPWWSTSSNIGDATLTLSEVTSSLNNVLMSCTQ